MTIMMIPDYAGLSRTRLNGDGAFTPVPQLRIDG
jgi:hypothetical protein